MEFNEKLQELRKQKGLTQEELAEQLSVAHVERVTFRKYRNTSAKKSPVVFCRISWLTLNRSRGRESLRGGKHNRKPRKRARSRDLAPKQRQLVNLIVKKQIRTNFDLRNSSDLLRLVTRTGI